jgi:hypothetical protein
MSLISLNIASDGYLDSPTPLTIATRGLIYNGEVTDEVVIVVPEERKRRAGAGPGARYISPYVERFKIDRRKEKERDIHTDDQEVLEILVQTILSGVIQ